MTPSIPLPTTSAFGPAHLFAKLRAHRDREGLSNEEIAKRLGMSVHTLQAHFSGRAIKRIDPELVRAIAKEIRIAPEPLAKRPLARCRIAGLA